MPPSLSAEHLGTVDQRPLGYVLVVRRSPFSMCNYAAAPSIRCIGKNFEKEEKLFKRDIESSLEKNAAGRLGFNSFIAFPVV